MNSVKHSLLMAVTMLALLFGPASPARAQSSTADELNKKVIELYQAGKFADAVPLAHLCRYPNTYRSEQIQIVPPRRSPIDMPVTHHHPRLSSGISAAAPRVSPSW